MFYDVFKQLCKEKNVSPSKAATEMGMNRSAVTFWKNETYNPSHDSLIKIANYFGVTVDYLVAEDNSAACALPNYQKLRLAQHYLKKSDAEMVKLLKDNGINAGTENYQHMKDGLIEPKGLLEAIQKICVHENLEPLLFSRLGLNETDIVKSDIISDAGLSEIDIENFKKFQKLRPDSQTVVLSLIDTMLNNQQE